MESLRNAIALIRVSSDAQAGPDRQGLGVQRTTCEQVAATNDLNIIEWVELEGVSGAAVLADSRFSELLRRLQSPRIDAVIVAAFDRLFRRGRFSDYAILDAFAETGTRLFSSDGELDLAAESGGLLGVIRGELAGMERRRIIERTTAGRRRKRRMKGVRAEGPVGMPRGVQFDYDTEKWKYVWPEAEKVREAFRLFLAGVHNLREIHRRTGIGSHKDASASVGRVLRQPLYMGIYRVDRTWEGKRAHPLPPEEIQEHEVLNPPLVPRNQWEEVQRILAARHASRPPRRDPETLGATYTGNLTCAACGKRVLTARDSREYTAYACPRKRDRCGAVHVSTRLADPVLDAELERILGDFDTLSLILEASQNEEVRDASPSAREIGRRLTHVENRRQRTIESYIEGVITREERDKLITSISNEKAGLEALMSAEDEIELPEGFVDDVVMVFASWRDLSRERKRELLRAYQVEIVVEKRGARKRSWLHVDRIRLGLLPAHVWLYKKMKRLGIE